MTDERTVRRLVSAASLVLSAHHGLPPHAAPLPRRPHRSVRRNDDDDDDFEGFVPLLRRFLAYAGLVGLLLFTSVVACVSLYRLVIMPSHDITVPLYFDHTGLAHHPAQYSTYRNAPATQTAPDTCSAAPDNANAERTDSNRDNRNVDGNDTHTHNHASTVDSHNESDSHAPSRGIHNSTAGHDTHGIDSRTNSHIDGRSLAADCTAIRDTDARSGQQRTLYRTQSQPGLPPNLSQSQQDMLAQQPWAAADLFASHIQWEHYQPDVVPSLPTSPSHHVLSPNRPYSIDILLQLPDPSINQIHVGMFATHVTLQSAEGTVLAVSLRSTHYPRQTPWIATLRKCILIVPILIGVVHESHTVVVPSYRHLVESTKHPLRYITARLVTHSSSVPPPQVTQGSVRIRRELLPYQQLITDWYYTCLLAGTTLLFALQSAACLLLHHFAQSRSSAHQNNNDSNNRTSSSNDADEASAQLELDGSFDDGDADGLWESTLAQDETEQRSIAIVATTTVQSQNAASQGGTTTADTAVVVDE